MIPQPGMAELLKILAEKTILTDEQLAWFQKIFGEHDETTKQVITKNDPPTYLTELLPILICPICSEKGKGSYIDLATTRISCTGGDKGVHEYVAPLGATDKAEYDDQFVNKLAPL